MTFKLNTWQTSALFLPFLVSLFFFEIPHADLYAHQTNFAVANLLMVFNVFVVILYQTQLVSGFYRQSRVKSGVFIWNAYFPAIFITLYLLDVAYSTFNSHIIHNAKYNTGPLKKSDLTGIGWIILLFLMHAFATFYFINNRFVAKKIELISDDAQREHLRLEFLIPMKRLIKISIWVTVIFFTLTTIVDIVRYTIL